MVELPYSDLNTKIALVCYFSSCRSVENARIFRNLQLQLKKYGIM